MRKIRSILSWSTALALLAGTAHAGPSTRREREETRQLNLQQAQQTGTNAPAAPSQVSQVPTATDAAASLADNAPPAAAPTQRVAVAMVAPAAAPTVMLNTVANPPAMVATARVVDDKGATVGAVQKILLDADGRPTKVNVALMGTGTLVSLDAAGLGYDQAGNVLTAQLDAGQIAQMPKIGG